MSIAAKLLQEHYVDLCIHITYKHVLDVTVVVHIPANRPVPTTAMQNLAVIIVLEVVLDLVM